MDENTTTLTKDTPKGLTKSFTRTLSKHLQNFSTRTRARKTMTLLSIQGRWKFSRSLHSALRAFCVAAKRPPCNLHSSAPWNSNAIAKNMQHHTSKVPLLPRKMTMQCPEPRACYHADVCKSGVFATTRKIISNHMIAIVFHSLTHLQNDMTCDSFPHRHTFLCNTFPTGWHSTPFEISPNIALAI